MLDDLSLEELLEMKQDLIAQRQSLADERLRADVDFDHATIKQDEHSAQLQEVDNKIHNINSDWDETLRAFWSQNQYGPKEREVAEQLEGYRQLDLSEQLAKKMNLENLLANSEQMVERALRILEDVQRRLNDVEDTEKVVQLQINELI